MEILIIIASLGVGLFVLVVGLLFPFLLRDEMKAQTKLLRNIERHLASMEKKTREQHPWESTTVTEQT